MIYILKRSLADPSIAKFRPYLSGEKTYCSYHRFLSRHDIIGQSIFSDQHGKCYICGRRLCTDVTVDHLRPLSRFSSRALLWSNLYLSCSYCNYRKGSAFDKILDPALSEIARLIRQEVDIPRDRFIFTPSDSSDPAQVQTASLLDDIFNGHLRSVSYIRLNMHRYAIHALIEFQTLCRSWLRSGDPLLRARIEAEISPKAEFLALKYWYMTSVPDLSRQFHLLLNLIL